VAENTRISLRLPSGRDSSLSLIRCLERIAKNELKWIEEGVSVGYANQPGWFNASGVLTSRVNWRVMTSGYCGPEVLELT
jgi:hypothetical protein